MNWPRQLKQALAGGPCVLVTMNLIAGSSPRESGCRMIVTADEVGGSIGGGNLEYAAIRQARRMLEESAAPRQVSEPYGLGPAFNQCCGGAVTVLYEVLAGACPAWVEAAGRAWDEGEDVVLAQAVDGTAEGDPPPRSIIWFRGTGEPPVPEAVRDAARALLEQDVTAEPRGELPAVEVDGVTWWLDRIAPTRWPLYLFGAGHVGREVARLLERLPFRVRWIDGRADAFPSSTGGQVTPVVAEDPVAEASGTEPDSIHVVMTHSHDLDEDICFALLQRGDFRWLGLIGSEAKAKRFRHRLAKRGIPEERLARLVCPIGLPGIRGKQPATIALSVAAQLMEERPWSGEERN